MNAPAYQDWSNYQIPGSDFVGYDVLPATALYNGPVFDVSAWHGLFVTMQNLDLVKYFTASVTWHGYQFSPLPVPVDQWVIGPSQTMNIRLPIKGRSMNMNWQCTSGSPTAGMQYAVTATSHEVTKYDVKQSSLPLISDNSAYASNQQKTFPGGLWYEGKALVSATSSAGGASAVNLQYYDAGSNTFKTYCKIPVLNNISAPPILITVPAAPIQANVMNSTTAQSIEFYLVPFPD